MSNASKRECQVIDEMFSWCANDKDLLIIKKTIDEVKNGNGLFTVACNCNGDLNSFKFMVSDQTGLNVKVSGELGRALWFIVKPISERDRMIRAGITHGTWVYTPDICQYHDHSKLNGKKFPLNKGAKIGFFKRVFPSQSVGCMCIVKPVLPF